METRNTPSTDSPFNKYEGIKTCIFESWKQFALHTATFTKNLGMHLLIAAVGFALFTVEGGAFYTQYIQPSQTYIEAGINQQVAQAIFSPSWASVGLLLVATLAALLAFYLFQGAVTTQVRFFQATGSLPETGPFTFWREIRKDGIKQLVFDLTFGVVFALLAALIGTLAWKTSPWVALILVPIFLYWSIICTAGKLSYTLGHAKLSQALPYAFRLGHHKFGGYFILLLLTSIPLLLVAYTVFLLVVVFHLAESANCISTLIGDPSGIAPYVLPLHLLTATAAFLIFGLVQSLQLWTFALYTKAHSRL